MAAQSVNDTQFEQEVLKSDLPVLVDFWAEWCGPCKMFSPTLDEYASETKGKIKVVKVNVDESPEAPTKYGVRSIPTLMVFKGGEVVAKTSGALPKTALVSFVDQAV